MTLTSSPEQPLPLRTVARSLGEWIGRLGRIWVEGQITQVSRRPGAATVFITLRDTAAEVSMTVTCPADVYGAASATAVDGARVVIWAKPDFYLARGTVSLSAVEIRPVGIGELLVRLERVKQLLAAEGLFAAERKKPLPFLPTAIGLITGRASAAERDVVENACRRWPAARFVTREVAVQGAHAVPAVVAALRELDRDPDVEVIVIARGGGSLEDLLPFSDESLCREVVACQTPVVSAIGHEVDSPLLDFVADVRCSTPTDAGKRVVPDVAEEVASLSRLRAGLRRAAGQRLDHEQQRLHTLRSRPCLAQPMSLVDRPAREVAEHRTTIRRCVERSVEAAGHSLEHVIARLRTLSPQSTLDRGYAVVRRADGAVVRDPGEAPPGTALEIRVAGGALSATVS